MSATKTLELPEPARQLWLRTRGAVRTSLDEIGGAEYQMGGGTVLAARWKHRVSYDVDLSLADTVHLYRLENPIESRFEHRMRELGGRPEYYRSLRMYQVRFGDQGLDLWVHAVEPPGSQGRFAIDGREETVLSNVQILWGKIETRTAGGVQWRQDVEAGRIRQALAARGLLGERRRHGPSMEALIEHAETLCREGAAETLIYREDARRATHWRTATAAHNLRVGATSRRGRRR